MKKNILMKKISDIKYKNLIGKTNLFRFSMKLLERQSMCRE